MRRRDRPGRDRPRGRRGGLPRPRLLPAVLLAVALAALSPTGPAGAQEELDVPAMAEPPRQFRLSATAGGLSWSEGPALSVEGMGLFGIGLERLLVRWASVRLAGAYGTTTVTGSGDRTAEVNAAVAELILTGRLAVPALRRAGVVPFAGLGLGTVVFDPEPGELTTRSQNALTYGAGLEGQPFPRIGFRAEWRRYAVELENLFDPTDRTGRDGDADRFQVSVFWSF